MTPLAVIICETVFLKEHAGIRQKLFIFLSIIGVLLITVFEGSNGEKDSLLGIFLLIIACLSEGLYAVSVRKSSENFMPAEITYTLMMFSAVAFNAINIIRRIWLGELQNYFEPLFQPGVLWEILYLSVLASGIGYLISSWLLSRMQASSISLFTGVTTVVSIVAGVLFRNETLFWYHMVGTALILISVWGGGKFIRQQNPKFGQN